MLQPATIRFLKALKQNNQRDWLEANKSLYQEAKADFEQVVRLVYEDVLQLHPEWHRGQVKDCVFRIFRDVRFSQDKSPYKAHFGAAFSATGKKDGGVGYYLHVEPGSKSFVAGGAWMPDADYLKRIRQEIDYNGEEWKAIVEGKDFVRALGTLDAEEKLQRVPKGYDPNHPAAAYLKLKTFTVSAPIEEAVLTDAQLLPAVMNAFRQMKPLIDFLERARG